MVQLKSKFNCKRCGWCCENKVINIAASDLMRWKKEGRKDILKEISWIHNYPRDNTGGFYIAQTAFNPKQACPFLKYDDNLSSCFIYQTRPRCCRNFPYGQEIVKECPGSSEISFDLDPNISKNVKTEQYKDFKLAFDNRNIFLKIIIEGR